MIKRILNKSSRILSSKQDTVISAAFVIGSIYLLSALLGFIKIRTLSAIYGDSTELGVFFAADDIPTIIFSLVVSGSLSSAFIPVFNRYYKRDPDSAWDITSSVLNISLSIFFVLSVLVIIGADFLATNVIARNSNLSAYDLKLLASLMRIMMLAQILFIVSNFFTSILQSFNRFVIPALAPVFYNIGIIFTLVLFSRPLGIYAPAIGMIVGAFLHMGIQMPAIKNTDFEYQFRANLRNRGVREIYKLMLPKSFGQIIEKLLIPLYTNLALFISGSSNVILTFAVDLQALPTRMFGVSIAQAALPIFSKSIEEDNMKDFKELLIKTIHQVAFFILPVSIVMFVLKVPLVRLAVGSRIYSWEATVMTAYTLGFYSLSLVIQGVILILGRAYYALHDTKTPVKISAFTVAINAALAIIFIKSIGLGVWSLAFAFAVASFLNCFLLFYFLYRKIGGIDIMKLLIPLNKIGITSLFTAAALYIPLQTMDKLLFDTTKTVWLIVLTGMVSLIGGFAYIFFSWLLKVEELGLVFASFQKLKSQIRST